MDGNIAILFRVYILSLLSINLLENSDERREIVESYCFLVH